MVPLPVIPTQVRHQKVTISLLFVAYLGGFGVFIPFFPVWLDYLGFNATWIAVLVATPLFIRVLTTGAVADWAERFADPRAPLRWLSLASLLLFLIMPVAAMSDGGRAMIASPWLLLPVVALMAVGWNALLPLTDATAIQVVRATRADYGRLRVWGSIAFVATSFIAGIVLERTGLQSIPWMVAALFLLFYLVALSLPRALATHATPSGVPKKPVSGWLFLLKRRGALSVFLGAGLMQASHAVLYGFGSISWSSQGFSDTTIGSLWALGVLCEIALFWVSRPVINRLGARGLLIIGGIAASFRWACFAFSPSLSVTVTLQVLHAFSFGMTHLAMIEYVAQRAKSQQLRAAQGVYGVVSGAIMALATLASGPLYQQFGAGAYLAMGIMTMLGTAIVLVNRLSIPAAGDRR
ncbi:MAG: MFS transporter [Pseudomonadota bacterium]